ncbi:hypothetical protein IJ425_09460 [bacterium]|nr:hypothetical protein [bacterium]
MQKDCKEKSKLELKPASENGYTFSEQEKEIIKQNNSRLIISKSLNSTGRSLNPNFVDQPQLRISDKEHEEIAYKTVGRVVEKIDQGLQI